jgi:hypothetical protein
VRRGATQRRDTRIYGAAASSGAHDAAGRAQALARRLVRAG